MHDHRKALDSGCQPLARKVAGGLGHYLSADQGAGKSDARTRNFYERAYTTEDWRRTEESEEKFPGLRFTKMWYRALLDYLVPRIDWNGKRVLEVGCGNGFLVPHLCRFGAEFVGVDIALNAVKQLARPDGAKCQTAVADATLLPFPSDSFDVLICMEVFEHIAAPDALLAECFRVIRPSGQLVFSCPNYLNLHIFPKILANLGVPFCRRYLRHQAVDRTTTALGLRRLLTRHGKVILQRGVRLHPPLFEQFDYRLSRGNWLTRINDFIFQLEKSWGDRPPLNYMGVHTIILAAPIPKKTTPLEPGASLPRQPGW